MTPDSNVVLFCLLNKLLEIWNGIIDINITFIQWLLKTVKKKKKKSLGTSPVVQWLRLCFHCRGAGLIAGWGTKIPHATWHSQNINKWINK